MEDNALECQEYNVHSCCVILYFIVVHYPQVERLWLRFQQLGADKNGILKASTIHKQHMSSNPFEEKVILPLNSV